MISTTCDAEANALYVRIAAKEAASAQTREIEPGVMLDMDHAGRVIGIEILDVRARSIAPAVAA